MLNFIKIGEVIWLSMTGRVTFALISMDSTSQSASTSIKTLFTINFKYYNMYKFVKVNNNLIYILSILFDIQLISLIM